MTTAILLIIVLAIGLLCFAAFVPIKAVKVGAKYDEDTKDLFVSVKCGEIRSYLHQIEHIDFNDEFAEARVRAALHTIMGITFEIERLDDGDEQG